ncbi:MAG TPA: hypothetical protein DHW82_01665 [Spirochaetia bacterium]|nr:MAG: hypothetical protein A2Y41_10150 [Spirochaetes bacterium GWB1_36_13]HCL55702.1 hypothetical protein [Spirochaetia bacterium]
MKTGLLSHIKRIYLEILRNYSKLILICYFLFTLFFIFRSFQIRLKTDYLDLLPQNERSVQDFKTVISNYGSEGYLVVVIEWKHLYTEALNWFIRAKEETEKVKTGEDNYKNGLDEALKRKDPKWFLSKKGIERMNNLVLFYKNIASEIEKFLYDHPNEKYFRLMSEELHQNIIQDTEKKWLSFEKDQSFTNLKILKESLEDNLYAFELYIKTITEKKGGRHFLIEAAEKLKEELGKTDYKGLIQYVEYRFKTSFIKDHLLYFIEKEDLQELKKRIEKKLLYERRRKLLPSNILVDEPVYLDFKDLEHKYEKNFKIIKMTLQKELFSLKDESYHYYMNKDETTLLLFVKPAEDSLEMKFSAQLVEAVKNASIKVQDEMTSFYPEILTNKEIQNKPTGNLIEKILFYPQKFLKKIMGEEKKNYEKKLSIGLTGRYMKKIETDFQVRKDLKHIFAVSLFLIFLLILISYRNFYSVFLIGFVFLSSLFWAIGAIELTVGYFNPATGFLLVVFAVLGIEFTINLFNRYLEERGRHKDSFESLKVVVKTTFVSNMLITISIMSGFSALIFYQIEGLRNFGFSSLIGLPFLFAGIFFSFPSLIYLSEKTRSFKLKKTKERILHIDKQKGKRFPYYKPIILFFTLLTLFSLFGVFKIRFNADFYHLGYKNSLSDHLREKAEQVIKMPIKPIVFYAKNWQTTEELTDTISEMKKNGELPTLGKLDSLSHYLPEEKVLKEKRRILKEIRELLNDSVLEKIKEENEKIKIKRLIQMAETTPAQSILDVPDDLKRQFISKTGGFFVFYYPDPLFSLSDTSSIKKISEDLKKITQKFSLEKVFLASEAVIFNQLFTKIKNQSLYILPFTFLLMFFTLWLNFRSIKFVFASFIPLVSGTLWTFGWIYLFKWELNYFNITIFPVIIGVSLNYGVHILHRLKEEGRENIFFIFRTTGISVFTAAAVNIVGIGSLIFSFYEGLSSMGKLGLAGLLTCSLAGSIFMLSLIEIRKDYKGKNLKIKSEKLEKNKHIDT